MKKNSFTCNSCKKEKLKQYTRQPVPISRGIKWCQHCWSTYIWGREWADKCENNIKENI